MKEKKKPKYNTIQNIFWMVGNAWKARKRVLLFVVLTAGLNVMLNLLQLFLAPEILRRVETSVPIPELLSTISLFTA